MALVARATISGVCSRAANSYSAVSIRCARTIDRMYIRSDSGPAGASIRAIDIIVWTSTTGPWTAGAPIIVAILASSSSAMPWSASIIWPNCFTSALSARLTARRPAATSVALADIAMTSQSWGGRVGI
jgi:hypothetical protein